MYVPDLNQELTFSLLLQHPVYFDSLFPKDFIFFFNVVDLERLERYVLHGMKIHF